ncbi:MAG: LysR family transcriptional regulator [Ideonella sp.]|nr:LysR family transcriptional regulator [Ideonella sp.]MBP6778853.1 LysR family transcriptional regulator [Piscinibacter sp.]
MHLQLDDVALFVRIVELGTLSAAARERDVPVSQVTRSLVRLEAACSARLLHRTTHHLSLTDEGERVLAHGRRLLDTAAELEGELSGRIAGPSGWVRIGVSPVLAQSVIAPVLASLYRKHPQLHVDIAAEDRIVDMAREGIDLALRTGPVDNENLVARPIADLARSLYAAPAYAAEFGLPKDADELHRHRLIGFSDNPRLNRWVLGREPGARELQVQGHTRTDNTAVVLALAMGGVGIARLADLVAQPLLEAGALVRVLDGQVAIPAVPMVAVMPRDRHRLPKVRAVVEHLLRAWH